MKKLIWFLYEKFNTILLLPHPNTIGNCSEEIFEALRVAKLRNKKVLLLLPLKINIKFTSIKTVNPRIFDLSSDLFLIRPLSIFLFPLRIFIWLPSLPFIIIWMIVIRYYQKGSEKNVFPYLGQEIIFSYQESKLENKSIFDKALEEKQKRDNIENLNLQFGKRTMKQVKKFKDHFKIIDSDWIVCLHVRTSSFHKDHTNQLYRNADIKKYYGIIKKIVDKGGIVIRLGDNGMPKINLPNIDKKIRIIDLAHSTFNLPEINSWIVANCEVFIGMQSGPLDLARLFQRPLILTNMYTPFFGIDNDKNSIGFYKDFINTKTRKKENIFEIISDQKFSMQDFSLRNYQLVESTEFELTSNIEDLIPYRQENYKLKNRKWIRLKHNDRMKEIILSKNKEKPLEDHQFFRWILRGIY